MFRTSFYTPHNSMTPLALKPIVLLILTFVASKSTCQFTYSQLSCALGRSYAAAPINENGSIYQTAKVIPLEKSIHFYVHTRAIPDGKEIFIGDSSSLYKSTFKPDRPTRILTHGYMADKTSPSCALVKDAYLQREDCNVVVVDWWEVQSIFGHIPRRYSKVVSFVGEVAQVVAAMIEFLENNGMNVETTTLVGHSLGAHVMGIAGSTLRNRVNYIVGLDPALPLFESSKPGERLSFLDAETVEVIHTNRGDCGIIDPIGHFDFYPNGGSHQPGCVSNTCSHSRVSELYAEAINSKNGFYGKRCANLDQLNEGRCNGKVALMGDQTKSKALKRGIYYLKTNEASPYAQGFIP